MGRQETAFTNQLWALRPSQQANTGLNITRWRGVSQQASSPPLPLPALCPRCPIQPCKVPGYFRWPGTDGSRSGRGEFNDCSDTAGQSGRREVSKPADLRGGLRGRLATITQSVSFLIRSLADILFRAKYLLFTNIFSILYAHIYFRIENKFFCMMQIYSKNKISQIKKSASTLRSPLIPSLSSRQHLEKPFVQFLYSVQ